MSCPQTMHVQAYFDGELDALAAVALERHSESCAECRALLNDLEKTRRAIRAEVSAEGAPAALRRRIAQAVDARMAARAAPQASLWRFRPFWIGAASGLGAAAAAVLVAVFLATPLLNRSLLEEILTEHVDSLTAGRPTSVESTDRHTVKPWFAGRADVSPVVQDFADRGYRLLGGRVDYLADQRAAVLVYQHGAHVIDVFAWRGHSLIPPRNTARRGYHLVFWTAGDLEYCAVSDAGWEELRALEQLLQELSERDP